MDKKIFNRIENPRLGFPYKVFGGFAYHCYRTHHGISYIRCSKSDSVHCKARGKMLNGRPHLSLGHNNHEADPKLEQYYLFQEVLYNATVSRPYQSLRLIYDHNCVMHHEASINYTWAKMQPVMDSWRRQSRPPRPPIPLNLYEYANFLRMPQWNNLLQYPQGHLSVSTLEAIDGSFVTIMFNSDFVASITTTTLFMDATFKITPRKPKVYQVFTILALVENKALPICWMLMTRKSALAYKAGLTYFRNDVAPHINPDIITTDFEASLKIAIAEIFPQVAHTGCFFHYCQALTKKLKQYGLLRLVTTWKYGQILVRKFMALALLPADDIIEGFHWLLNNMPAEILQMFNDFLVYFYNQWIIRIPPRLWSVYNLEHETNNLTEAYHRKMNIRFKAHPTIWEFTETLTRLQAITHVEYQSLNDIGEMVVRDASARDIDRKKKTRIAWQLYNHNVLDIPNFLACASSFLQAFHGYVIHEAEDEQQNIAGNYANPINNYDNHLIFLELDIIEEQ